LHFLKFSVRGSCSCGTRLLKRPALALFVEFTLDPEIASLASDGPRQQPASHLRLPPE
jgi:hypothetical protein